MKPQNTWRVILAASILISFLFISIFGFSQTPSIPSEIKSPQDVEAFLRTVSDEHAYIDAPDGTCLFFRQWRGGASARNNPAVLVLHGIGYHGGPYKMIADGLNPKGIDVFALDDRGHGLSCGKRGAPLDFHVVVEDINAMIRFIRQENPARKVYLLGESMGGALALDYAAAHPDNIDGLILLAPAVSVSKGQLFSFRNAPLLPDLLFTPDKPAVSLVDERLALSSRDEKFVADRRKDPLSYDMVSVNYLLAIGKMGENWRQNIAPFITVPTMLMQGGKDPVVDGDTNATMFGVLAAKEKEFYLYRDVPHTLLFDPQTPKVIDAIRSWIERH
jgi:acylglycerol lipase